MTSSHFPQNIAYDLFFSTKTSSCLIINQGINLYIFLEFGSGSTQSHKIDSVKTFITYKYVVKSYLI